MHQGEQGMVGKLVLSAANRILREVLIDRKRLTIGRRPYNDLLLDDLTVSGEHAIVHTASGESVIHDLKSRNGTLSNGAPVMQQQLADGDCVDIGIYRLVYKVERLASRRVPVPRTGLMPQSMPGLSTNLGGARTSAWVPNGADAGVTRAPAIPAPMEEVRPATLRFLGGHDAGRQQVLERPIVSVRNGSGQVAVVARRQNGYFLTHVEGLAYPLVNGESIGLGAHVLRDNDLIELAGTIIQFSLDR